MEDHLQTIIGIILSVFLFFVFPVYMAYEKKDDVSYALALKYSQEFVESVQKTGYLSKEMYESYKTKLRVTGNSYDIKLTHRYQKTEPIVDYFEKDVTKDIVNKIYSTSREYYDSLSESDKTKLNTKLTYKTFEEVYDTKYILNTIQNKTGKEDSNIYVMNPGDEFVVSITNTNITPATLIFNMITIKAADSIERIYVNSSGKILNSYKYDKAFYSFENTGINSNVCEYLKLTKDDIIGGENTSYIDNIKNCICKDNLNKDIECSYSKNFTIEFDALPSKVTPLKNVDTDILKEGSYSILINGPEQKDSKVPMYVSVGTNGIDIMYRHTEGYNTNKYTTLLSYAIDIYEYTNIKIEINNNIPSLYINGELVSVGRGTQSDLNINSNYIYIGKDTDDIGTYYGRVKNIRIYTKNNK